MSKFWFLLTLAFVDVALALVLGSRGYATAAYLFLLVAGVLGAYAFLSTPSTHRDARGRLQRTELPYGSVLGAVGALVMLSSAAYVAVISTRPAPKPAAAARVQAAPRPTPPPEPAYVPPRSDSPAASNAALYKCVDPAGHATYQSMPCPGESEQAWVRDATPEPEPTLAQRRQMARQREADGRRSATYSPGYAPPSSPSTTRPENSGACQAARAADAAYRRRPLRQVTHDGLRWHGEQIRAACN